MTEEIENSTEPEIEAPAEAPAPEVTAEAEAEVSTPEDTQTSSSQRKDPRDELELPLESIVEALLIASPQPRTAKQLAASAGSKVKPQEVTEAIAKLNQYYLETSRAFEIMEINSAYQIMTLPGYAVYLRPALKGEEDGKRKLSAAALDTLAIVAYKQPVMRVEIDTIRGVHCGPMLRHLIELDFVKVIGRNKEILGYPMLYGTTDHFLETFGLASIEDLPSVEELHQP